MQKEMILLPHDLMTPNIPLYGMRFILECAEFMTSVQFVWEKRIGHLASENNKMTEFVNKSRKVDDRLHRRKKWSG